ncbi:hypothetical protein ACSBR1_021067 [Camellia fascicularis]
MQVTEGSKLHEVVILSDDSDGDVVKNNQSCKMGGEEIMRSMEVKRMRESGQEEEEKNNNVGVGIVNPKVSNVHISKLDEYQTLADLTNFPNLSSTLAFKATQRKNRKKKKNKKRKIEVGVQNDTEQHHQKPGQMQVTEGANLQQLVILSDDSDFEVTKKVDSCKMDNKETMQSIEAERIRESSKEEEERRNNVGVGIANDKVCKGHISKMEEYQMLADLTNFPNLASMLAFEATWRKNRKKKKKNKKRKLEIRAQNDKVVHFRSLQRPKEDDFCLELGVLFPVSCHYSDRRGRRLHLLIGHTLPIFLYYEVLDIPLPELQCLKTLKVAFHHATKDEVVIHTIRLPRQSTVGDVLDELKTKAELSHPDAELRLLEVFYHKIYKIFPLNEKNENIKDQYWTLWAEEGQPLCADNLLFPSLIPEEQKNLGPLDRLIHVYHFTKKTGQNQMVWKHLGCIWIDVSIFFHDSKSKILGNLFFLVVHAGETLAEVKVRVQKKLQVPDEEFCKWKFAFLSMGLPEYLQDTDVVTNRFQRRDVYGAWERCLRWEHSDTAPKRAYQVNQNRLTFEKAVKIYN